MPHIHRLSKLTKLNVNDTKVTGVVIEALITMGCRFTELRVARCAQIGTELIASLLWVQPPPADKYQIVGT